jgi:N-acylneuraminate cytidylyltransferase
MSEEQSRVVAVVPLRGGSKSIPRKNIKLLGGKPLCAWVLEAACVCPDIDQVVVSTDDAEIKAVVQGLGLPVDVLDRPESLAGDTSSSESVVLHALVQYDCDIVLMIQATSPLTTTADFSAAVQQFSREGCDSMVTGVVQHRFYWQLDGTPLNYDPLRRPMRQEWSGSLVENGAFYLTKADLFRRTQCRLGGKIGVYAMSPEHLTEIDEPEDWDILAGLLRQRASDTAAITTLVCDVDGTLTDGAMFYDAQGEAMKRFDTRDAKGLALLRDAGVQVWIMTGEDSDAVRRRCEKLGLSEIWLGVQDKGPLLQRVCEERGIDLVTVAYIGDDVNDCDCLRLVGLPACPADAQPAVKALAAWRSAFPGGQGAVREFCEMLLQGR